MTRDRHGILFIHRNNHPQYYGGIERKILSIVSALHHQHGFRCHLLTNFADSPLAVGAASAGAVVHQTSMSGPLGVFRTADETRRLVDEHGIDLLQSHMFWGSVAAAMARIRKPSVRHVFRIHTHIAGSTIPIAKQVLYHGIDRLVCSGVDHYCVLSRALAAELRRRSRIPSGKITVLLNGIPGPGTPHPIQDDAEALPFRIAVVGDLQPRKRQDLVVEALAQLDARGLSVHCTMIGLARDQYGETLRSLAERLGVADRIHFAGFQDPITPWLTETEVMVLQSDFEGIPTCMIEAMALGMLCVSSDVGGTRDLIDDAVNGFLVPPGDPVALADRLESIFRAPSNRLAPLRRAGLTTFHTRCSLDAMMAGLLETYARLGIGETRSAGAAG